MNLTEPRTISAHYEIKTGNIVIHIRDGAVFMFPHHLGQGLARARAEDLGHMSPTDLRSSRLCPQAMGCIGRRLMGTLEYFFITQGNLWNSHLDGTASCGESIIALDIGAIEPRKSAKTKPP